MKKLLFVLLLACNIFAQDTSSTKVSQSERFWLFYPGGYLLNFSGSDIANAAVGFEYYAGKKWSALTEVTYRKVNLSSEGSGAKIPGDMFAIKGAGRYYMSGRDGWFFMEPALAFGYVPKGFPGSDHGASENDKMKALVQSYVSAGVGLGIRTGNDGKSKWSFTLGYHLFLPVWTKMTGEEMDNEFENFFMDLLGDMFFDQILPYRSRDVYIGMGYHF